LCRYRHEGYGGRRPVRARSADGRRSQDLMTTAFDPGWGLGSVDLRAVQKVFSQVNATVHRAI
jgi:hypothetical protein